MKRLIALLAVGAAVAAAFAASSVAVGDTKGPPCANIVFGDGSYTYFEADGETPVAQPSLDFRVDLAAPSCAAVTYTLYIYDSTGALVDTLTVSGVRGQPSISFDYTFETTADADAAGLCLVGTTSLGKHVADRAPDQGCVPLTPGSGGGVGFQ